MAANIIKRLGAFQMMALDQGFSIVQLERGEGGEPTVLRMGYRDDRRRAVAIEFDERALGDRGHFAGVLTQIGSLGRPSSPAPAPATWLESDPLELLAAQYLEACQAARRAEALGERLLAQMRARGRTSIDVVGVGAVTYQKPGWRDTVDKDATIALLAGLAAKLQAHGETVNVALPMKTSAVAAHLRVTQAE